MKDYSHGIFKAYDIRGIVATELTAEVVEDIGKVLGTLAIEANVANVVVGRDGRLSSPELALSLARGVNAAGCGVIDIGEVTTPMVYFANYELKTYSGVMVTGSHNPPEYNGLKMVIAGETLFGDKIQEIYTRLVKGDYIDNQSGSYMARDITEEYLTKITSDIKLNRKVNLVVDAGNGVAGKIAPRLYRRMGARATELFCQVDGTFPNHHPDPSKPENLQDLIAKLAGGDYEVGFAFDGDGDRLGVVTRDGNIIYPDRQMMLFAADVLANNPGAKIIYDVKSSGLLPKWIKEHGGVPVMCRTGHSYVKAKIREIGAKLAGEMSGHIFFNDRWSGADDGVYAGARLLAILAQVDDVSALLNSLPNSYATPEINIAIRPGTGHQIIENLQQNAKFAGSLDIITIDGLRVEYNGGFGLVRASNTTPILVLRFEADSLDKLETIKAEFREVLKTYVDQINF